MMASNSFMGATGRRPAAAAATLLPLVAACYTYAPLATVPPPEGTRVAFVLSDQGRVDAAPQVGPLVDRVEGAVASATDADYVVQVSDVIDVRGRRTRWAGEMVPLPRTAVAMTFQRRLSRPRTVLLVAGLASAFVFAITSRQLLGFGREADGKGPAGGDPNEQ